MERDCESKLPKLNIEQNACIYHFGASVIHGQRSNILRLHFSFPFQNETVPPALSEVYSIHALTKWVSLPTSIPTINVFSVMDLTFTFCVLYFGVPICKQYSILFHQRFLPMCYRINPQSEMFRL